MLACFVWDGLCDVAWCVVVFCLCVFRLMCFCVVSVDYCVMLYGLSVLVRLLCVCACVVSCGCGCCV